MDSIVSSVGRSLVGTGELFVQFVTMDERFWLCAGTNWTMVRNGPGIKPQPHHLTYVIGFSLCLLALRVLFERYIALPLGRLMGVSEGSRRLVVPNAVLEKIYRINNRKVPPKDVLGLAKTLDWSEREVQRWLRQRKAQDIPSNMVKFRESSWRLVLYLSLLVMGTYIVPSKTFWKDTTDCWRGYPTRGIDADVFWYYMAELSFYTSLTMSQFMDVRRKDFWEMLIHHVATIMLISFSFIVNFSQIGALIMFVHDWADPFLELAKSSSYARKKNEKGRSIYQLIGEVGFITFMCIFLWSRLYFYPKHLIYSAWFELLDSVGPSHWPLHNLFVSLLCLLWCLHCFWSYHIIRVLAGAIVLGKVKGDTRSDTDDSGPDDISSNGSAIARRRIPNGSTTSSKKQS